MSISQKNLDQKLIDLIGTKDVAIMEKLSDAEKACVENAALYIELANRMHQGFWIDGKTHKTIYANKIYQGLSGYTLEELRGKASDFCFTEESKKLIKKHHKLRGKGVTSQYEADMVAKDGTITPVLINGTPTKEGGTMGLLANFALMDKLSRNEQNLLKIIGYKNLQTIKKLLKPSEIELLFKYRHAINLANAMKHCFWIGDRTHKTIYANKFYQKLTEYSLEECIGKPANFCFTERSKRTIAKHHKLRKVGISSQYEAIYKTKSGKKIPVLIIGTPSETGGTYGIHIDLRETKKVNAQKTISEQIIKNSAEAIVIMDKNHNITMWNDGASRIFGYKESEVLNKKLSPLVVPKELKKENKKLIEDVDVKKFVKNFETKRQTKSGAKIDVSLSISKVLNSSNQPAGYLVIYQDITQRKRVNTELQKRFEAIQDAYKELGLQKRQNDYTYEIVDMGVTHDGLERLCKFIVSATCMLTKCDATILRLLEKNKKILRLKACLGVSHEWMDKSKINLENSLAEDAYKTGRPIIIQDIESSSKHRGVKLLKAHEFKILILIPLIVNGELIGTLSMYATDSSKFRLIEKEFLERFGKQCSLALKVKSCKK